MDVSNVTNDTIILNNKITFINLYLSKCILRILAYIILLLLTFYHNILKIKLMKN